MIDDDDNNDEIWPEAIQRPSFACYVERSKMAIFNNQLPHFRLYWRPTAAIPYI